jgi:hypothetical protein
MKINSDNEDHDSIIIAMEVGYQAIVDLIDLYKEINRELLKQLAIFEGKSTKEIKKEIKDLLLIDSNTEKDLLSKIKASQEIIKRFNNSIKKDN